MASLSRRYTAGRSRSAEQSRPRLLYFLLLLFCVHQTARANGVFAHISPHFEPNNEEFTLQGSATRAEISPAQLTMRPGGTEKSLSIRWTRSRNSGLIGEKATGGVSNYFPGRDQSKWRTAVPHYTAVRAPGLYQGIDAIYHLRDDRLEFDLELAPHANPARAEFKILSDQLVTLDSSRRSSDRILTRWSPLRPTAGLSAYRRIGARDSVRVCDPCRKSGHIFAGEIRPQSATDHRSGGGVYDLSWRLRIRLGPDRRR